MCRSPVLDRKFLLMTGLSQKSSVVNLTEIFNSKINVRKCDKGEGVLEIPKKKFDIIFEQPLLLVFAIFDHEQRLELLNTLE